MKLIKLTDENGNTRNNTHWSPGTTCSITQENRHPQLCSSGVLHAYTDINLALLFNPAHSAYKNPRIFSVEGEIVTSKWDNVGCYELLVLEELSLPEWYTDENKRREVQINFAVLCAEAVLPVFEAAFPNDNRPRTAIEAVKSGSLTRDIIDAVYEAYIDVTVTVVDVARAAAADAIARVAAATAAANAAVARVAAATAADAAATAADAAYSAANADAAAYAVTYDAVGEAFRAVYYAYCADVNINLAAIAQKAVDMLDE